MIRIKTKLCGFYKIEAVKKDGSKRLLADWFPNIITDIGLDRIGTSSLWYGYCQVGSGSTAPAEGDTALVSYVANTLSFVANTNGVTGSSLYYRWNDRTYRFAEGVAEGNLSEVGVGWAAEGSLFNRALILDGEGSPITITVLSDEYLDVTYSCRRYLPESDVSPYTIELRSVEHTITGGKASLITNTGAWDMPFRADYTSTKRCTVYDGAIGAITASPSGASSYTESENISAYTPGTYYRDWTYSFALTEGNLGNYISAIAVYMVGGYYQFGVSPDIEKTSDDIMSLTFRAGWGRK